MRGLKKSVSVAIVLSVLCFSLTAFAAEKRDAIAKNGMVAAADPRAAQVGVDILKKGGNAFDAAVATAFALFSVEPHASGMGGGGFAIVYVAKEDKTYIVDYRESAPAKALENFYVDLEAKTKVPAKTAISTGWYSSGVPGMLAGMDTLNKKFGSMKWADLISPSIALLEKGVVVDKTLNGQITDMYGNIEKSPTPGFFQKTYLKDGLPIEPGQPYRNGDLIKTYKLVAKKGASVFYKGELADKIAAAYAKHAGGWITKKDLAGYAVTMREPIEGTYRGYKIASVPPPSSGGLTIIEILNTLENFDMKKLGYGTADSVHVMIEAQKLAYADRKEYIGDPAFVKVPVKALASSEYAKARAASIDMNKAAEKVGPGDVLKITHGNTTSLSVIDKKGNMVTITHSINSFFGAMTVPDGTGILMNNHMDDFDWKPGTVNSVAPGKKPLSSMAPTLISKDGKPFMTLGSPGGPRIIIAVANIIVNVIDYGMDLQAANDAPRFYNPNTAKTPMENRFSAEVIEALKAKGQQPELRKEYDNYFGGAQAIMVLPDGSLHGSGDLRRAGVGIGY